MNRQQRRMQSKKSRGPARPSVHELLRASVQLLEARRFRDAERGLEGILRVAPAHPDALHVLGILANTEKRYADAVDFIRRAISVFDKEPTFFVNLGHAYTGLNGLATALACFEAALELNPDLPEARSGRLRAAKALGLMKRILATHETVLRDDPANLDALFGYGDTLLTMEQHVEALEIFDRLLSLAPPNARVLTGRGTAFLGLFRFDAALVCLDMAFSLDPNNANALNNRGVALNGLRRFSEAEQSLRAALQLVPDSPEIMMNLSSALRGLGRAEEALQLLETSIEIKPDYCGAHANRANALIALRRFDDAKRIYADIAMRWPDYADARWNDALLDLLLGDFEPGFLKFEARWDCPALGLTKRVFAEPLWLGEAPLGGKTILIYNDQGLGDGIQFCRYAPLLAAMGARVILQVQPSLVDLLSAVDGVWLCTTQLDVPAFDYQCSLGTLPLAFKTRLDSIPANIPYLRAPADSIARDFGLAKDHRLKVGLIWAGNSNHGNDHNRSMVLAQFAALFDLPVQFVSLMVDVRPSDRVVLDAEGGVLDCAASLKSFSDTAALVSQLDLVISVDTSVAHLAGALGSPVWILLPHVVDWRWMLEREDSPWYPTARLFRQTESGDWPGVIARVRAALLERVNSRDS